MIKNSGHWNSWTLLKRSKASIGIQLALTRLKLSEIQFHILNNPLATASPLGEPSFLEGLETARKETCTKSVTELQPSVTQIQLN